MRTHQDEGGRSKEKVFCHVKRISLEKLLKSVTMFENHLKSLILLLFRLFSKLRNLNFSAKNQQSNIILIFVLE